jgi:hypothetical protein
LLWTMILLIPTSHVARIIGMSHWCSLSLILSSYLFIEIVSLCISGWPGTQDPSASATRVLELQAGLQAGEYYHLIPFDSVDIYIYICQVHLFYTELATEFYI